MIYHFQSSGLRYTYNSISNIISDNIKMPLVTRANKKSGGFVISGDEFVQLPRSVKVYFELTQQCNLKCRYCYRSEGNSHASCSEISQDEKYSRFVKILENLFDRFDNIHVVFYGGEPLLEMELLIRLVEYCDNVIITKNKGITYGITTNGILLDEENLDLLVEKSFHVTMSFDGDLETMRIGRGIKSTKVLERALDRLHQNGVGCSVLATLYPETISRFEKNLDYLLNLPVTSIKLLTCDTKCSDMHLNRTHVSKVLSVLSDQVEKFFIDEDYIRLQKIDDLIRPMRIIDSGVVPKRHCGYGNEVLAISSDGRMYPCPCFVNIDGYEVMNNSPSRYPNLLKDIHCKCCVAFSTCPGICYYTHYIGGSIGPQQARLRCSLNRYFLKLALEAYARLYMNGESV